MNISFNQTILNRSNTANMGFRKSEKTIEKWVSPLFHTSSIPQIICKGRELIEYNQAFIDLLQLFGVKDLKNRPIEWFFPFFQKDGSLSGETYRDYMELATTIGSQKFDWHMGAEGKKQLFVEVTLDHFRVKEEDYFLTSFFDIGKLMQELIVQREEIMFGVN